MLGSVGIGTDRMGHRPSIACVDMERPFGVARDLRLAQVIRWRGRPIRAVKTEHLEDLVVADRPARIGEHLGDPSRFGVQLALLDVGFAPARVSQDQPREPGPDDETDDEQPPVELGVHGARVQGSGRMRSGAAPSSSGGAATALAAYTPQS